MNILHTADWHLGKRLEQFERTDEHRDFLDWLICTLDTELIDLLIVAGDVFDTGSPSNTAFELYYKFLRRVQDTCCRNVIIVGGNHDSISTLNAPRDMLRYNNVHVIGGVPDLFTDQIIEIRNAQDELELIVCAVPFLRDKDIRLSVSGETTGERELRIKKGITDHYQHFVPLIEPYRSAGIPVMATGHLFAAGSSTSESEKEIHVGNLGQVSGDQFPVEFGYIALGHIHRPQLVNQLEHIRYSGSPVALSFSENEDRKQVLIIEVRGPVICPARKLEVPCGRRLLRIKGKVEGVKAEILNLRDQGLKYPAWVEIQVETDSFITGLDEQLNNLRAGKPFIDAFFISQRKIRVRQDLDQLAGEALVLSDLTPREVFLKRCQAESADTDYNDLIRLFDEAIEGMDQIETR